MLSPRTILVTLLSVSLVLACNTRTHNPADRNAGYLATIQYTFGDLSCTDSLTYDSLHRLVRFRRIGNDGPAVDFSYAGNSVFPASYFWYGPHGEAPERHRLWYDVQNRIIKDTTFQGGPLVYYRYPGDSVLIVRASKITGNDTLLSKNGFVTKILTPGYVRILEYSLDPNPAYYIPSAAMRLLLFEFDGGGFPGWLSSRPMSSLFIASPGSSDIPGGEVSYRFTLAIDTDGTVTRMYDPVNARSKCDIRFTYY